MKKLLIIILIILLCVLGYFAIFNGISIGNFQILSVSQIKEKNDKLDQEISDIETQRVSTFPSKTSELGRETDTMMSAKKTYLIEFLWTRMGNHATKEGVIAKFEIVSGDTGDSNLYNINFTITGHYIAIINFVSAIENDSKLGFRIENFKVVPGGDDLTATFVVRNIRIKNEKTTTSTTQTQTTDTTNTTTNTTETTVDNTTTTNTQS